jgi:hypothetical protein
MKRTGRLTTSLTVAALLTLPAAGFAQATAPQNPPPAAAQSQPQPTPQTGSSAQEAARVHLTAARNTLSQLTQLPAASQLQGEPRAQVAELITNFNELITTQANWKEAYEKVEANLATLLNSAPTAPAGDPAKPVGTSGATGIDPGVRAKLIEFRSHLDKFEEAASPSAAPTASTTSSTTTTTTTTTAEPPATQPPTTQPPPTTPPAPTNPAKPDEPAAMSDDQKEEVMNHIDAIEAILSAQATAQAAQTTATGPVGTSGTASGSTRTTITGTDVRLTPAQVEQLRNHLAELRRIISK